MQQITRGDYLKDLITIYVDNNLQTSLTDLYSQFVFQCGEIQKVLTPAQVIKISFDEIESQLLKSTNTCYLAGITTDGHKETFNGSLTFNTRGEVVYYEPPVSTVIPAATETTCDCQGLRGVFSNCTQPAIKAYFSLNYVPTKLSELTNDTDYQDGLQVAESISIHNASTDAHPYIQDLIATEASLRASQTNALGIRIGTEESVRASQTSALHGSIEAEATARNEAISLAISTTEGYADTQISNHNSSEQAHPYIQSALVSATEAINVTIGNLDNLDTADKSSVVNAINSEVTARENADNNLQGQIDGLAAASDVTDIVGTYAELQAYDTQHLNDNDIIKVLSDSTHEDEPSYYRFDKDTDTFSYIGSESASYTKAQSDSIFVTQTTEINGHALSSDINLTPSDIGALADSYATVISANTSAIATNTSAIASNTSVIAQHTTAIASNTSDISTINGKIPTDASSSNKLVSASALAASIADFANQNLSNLTSNGEARLHALKSYADNGELLTDADGLSFVKKYAHSTFDLSKFTVVGSPNITDDGIASGFSGTSWLTKTLTSFEPSQNWKIHYRILTPPSSPSSGNYYMIGSIGSAPDRAYVRFSPVALGVELYKRGDSTIFLMFNDAPPPFNTWCDIEFGQEKIGTTIKTYIRYKRAEESDISYVEKSSTSSSELLIPSSNTIHIGNWYNYTAQNFPYNSSIDLKQFSITVDGVEVFNGNKTGIDTIKPDDYAVVGTPAITSDGIASGFSATSVIQPNYDFNNASTANSWEVYIKLKTGSSVGVNQNIFANTGSNYTNLRLLYGKLVMEIGGGSSFLFSLTGIATLQANTVYYVKFVFTGTKYQIWLSTDGITYTLDNEGNSTDKFVSQGTWSIGSSYNMGQYAFLFLGSIDLNSFKIYVDGNLVYQPCLKIPYTQSKTGSKIVNSIYRDRVNDMAEQFGYANYYTLSDTDFTLPQVELYGLIGQRTLRDSYRNGINYWELYSNRDLEQGGSCTSGVEVTFARPFADTNYVLSVPYSAKSTTAFTPTQTGDWIAKGKGIL